MGIYGSRASHRYSHAKPGNEVKSIEALGLSRSGAAKLVPIKTFDVSKITQAYRFSFQKN